jgi:hypothetical protein
MTTPFDGDPGWHSRYSDARARILREDAGGHEGVAGLLHGLCKNLASTLGVMGAAVNLMSAAGSDGVAAASDDRCRDVDELQFTTGEGPCHAAFAARRPVLTPDLRAAAVRQWPGYASAALASGVGAVFAFPIHIGGVGFGVLDVYAAHPGSMRSEQMTLALTYAQIATEIMLDGDLTTAKGELDPGLSTALDYRAEIHQAQGMAMVDLGVGPGEALARMRAHAFAHDRPLIDLARDIIGGFKLPAVK